MYFTQKPCTTKKELYTSEAKSAARKIFPSASPDATPGNDGLHIHFLGLRDNALRLPLTVFLKDPQKTRSKHHQSTKHTQLLNLLIPASSILKWTTKNNTQLRNDCASPKEITYHRSALLKRSIPTSKHLQMSDRVSGLSSRV